MKPRIVTHGNCTDGFCSAFMVKRYFNLLFGTGLSEKEIQEIPILGTQPQDVQQGKVTLTKGDIVLDLPKPSSKVLFWCDHHLSNKPEEDQSENYFWKVSPSCTGYLINLLIDRGVMLTDELRTFKEAIDTNDGGNFSKGDIKACYYPHENYYNPTSLQKLAMIGAMFNTKDFTLNEQMFRTLLSLKPADTPLVSPAISQLNPELYHRAQLENYRLWRKCVDTYLEYKEEARTVLQDDRKVKFIPGVADRFYSYMKFQEASYNLVVRRPEEETIRIGMGSNIFHKDRCKLDLGGLCSEVGKKFGGTGGGHYYVGGATIRAEKCDQAIAFILGRLEKSI
ncbi:MAG: DHHA1 domain-containing protein [Nanoarchaeota archaeon]